MPSLQSAWVLVERTVVPVDASRKARIDAQVAFYMGVHAALSAQLQATVEDDPAALDVLHILNDEVQAFFELFSMPRTVPN